MREFESSFSPSYELVMDAYRKVSGSKAKDSNTKAGAREFARAIDDSELDREDLEAVIKAALNDPKVPNQTLRGAANNFSKYLPKNRHAAGMYRIRFQCDCGFAMVDRRQVKPELDKVKPMVKETKPCQRCGKPMRGQLLT